MLKKSVVGIMAVVIACMAGTASADVVFADSSSCVLTIGGTFSGAWNTGSPYNYLTIAPDGQGERLDDLGTTNALVTVTLKNSLGQPIAGVPRQEIILFNTALCICPGGNLSDAGTDANGVALFTGSINGGGCATGLDCFADGVFLGTVGMNVNSTDTGIASPCFTDAGDLAAFAGVLGVIANYNICFDYNESGPPTIDASDLGFFAAALGAACQ